MRIVITGATGNVGTSVIHALKADASSHRILGLARRASRLPFAGVELVSADVTKTELEPLFEGADAVVHLAWEIQPSHRPKRLERSNVEGSKRVFTAAARARVPALVYASSVGAYSRANGFRRERADESWPTHGIASSLYSRQKAAVEAMLDRFEAEHSHMRVVRMRPALIFKRGAASEIRRYFAGPLLPRALLRRDRVPIMPDVQGLEFQAVHSLDVGEAFRLAIESDARGAFNVAAEPILTTGRIATLLDARQIRVPMRVLRAFMAATYAARLQPTEPGWLDLACGSPLMDTTRIQRELGWHPRHSAIDAVAELLDGIGRDQGIETPPLSGKEAVPA